MKGCEGRSFLLMEIYAADIFAAVSEFEKHLRHSRRAGLGEDVGPQAGRVIKEVDVGEESSEPLGAFERVVSEVGEVALFGSII